MAAKHNQHMHSQLGANRFNWGSLDIESMVTPVFATLIFDNIIGLIKFIRGLNRATMSSAPDEPQKNYTVSDEPFRYTVSSTGSSSFIINEQYLQYKISDYLNNAQLYRAVNPCFILVHCSRRCTIATR
ncbi:hypothetical protein [Klebsiella pneumoniae]|uniref:hypothetical protein n=1 Tax=Klebsiella pneumoniae TaxID=573 RepID=UPI00115B4FDE|nr:hypothetical protein [Klebsiella pneumoniae]